MMAVAVTTSPTFSAGKPQQLFEGAYAGGYDVAADGQRFVTTTETEDQTSASTQIHVVLNWFEELKSRVPSGKK